MTKIFQKALTLLMLLNAMVSMHGQSVIIGGHLNLVNVPEKANATEVLMVNNLGEVEKVPINTLVSMPPGMILLCDKINEEVLLSNNFSVIGATVIQLSENGLSNVEYGEWTAPPLKENMLSSRKNAKVVWTGSEVFFHGGSDDAFFMTDGARYNPFTNTWLTISQVNRPIGHYYYEVVVNNEIYVFYYPYSSSSSLALIKKYNLANDTWTDVNNTNGPTFLNGTSAAGNIILNIAPGTEGKKFDIASASWSNISMSNAPSPRFSNAVGWSGSECMIWGGVIPSTNTQLNDGKLYNPVTNTWRPMQQSPLSARIKPHTFWTGSEFIIWGGEFSTQDGARYNPTTNSWTIIPNPGVNLSNNLTVGWTGSNLLIVDITSSRTFKYNLANNAWTELNNMSMPPNDLANFTTCSIADKLFIWGGMTANIVTFEGYIFDSSIQGYPPLKTKKYYLYKKA